METCTTISTRQIKWGHTQHMSIEIRIIRDDKTTNQIKETAQQLEKIYGTLSGLQLISDEERLQYQGVLDTLSKHFRIGIWLPKPVVTTEIEE